MRQCVQTVLMSSSSTAPALQIRFSARSTRSYLMRYDKPPAHAPFQYISIYHGATGNRMHTSLMPDTPSVHRSDRCALSARLSCETRHTPIFCQNSLHKNRKNSKKTAKNSKKRVFPPFFTFFPLFTLISHVLEAFEL